MAESIAVALQITLAGMGLVFAMICVLWLGMGLLVRLTEERQSDVAQPLVEPEQAAAAARDAHDHALRRKAAAVAVAAALASEAAAAASAPSTAAVSPWQAVARSNQLRHRGRVR